MFVSFDTHVEVQTLWYNHLLGDCLDIWKKRHVVCEGTPVCLPEAVCEGILIAPPPFLLLEIDELPRILGWESHVGVFYALLVLLFPNVKVDVV